MRSDLRRAAAELLAGRPAVVALSGGADSAVAAWMCAGGAARAVHVHHGLPASDQMERAAVAVASALDLPLTVLRVDPASSSETASRAARWGAIRRELADGEVVVTGHTQDDQAETVVINLVRGAGPQGLAGMRHRADVVRPLMTWSREEVREVARGRDLPFVDDPENTDPRHVRTTVRSEVLPLLNALNPSVVDALARAADHQAAIEVSPVPTRRAAGVVRIPLPFLRTTSQARAVETIRVALRTLRPPYPPSAAEVDRVLEVARGGRRAEVEGGIVALRDRTSLRLGPIPDSHAAVPLEAGGRWGGFGFTSSRDGVVARSPAMALLPAGKAWEVRGAGPTDRISMGGGHKLVWDALAECGVPPELRGAWPVVHDDGEIAWVPLVRRAPDSRPSGGGYLLVDVVEEPW